MSKIKLVAACAAAVAIGTVVVACGGDDPLVVQSGTVIQNVTIVNTRDGSLTTGKTVVIDGGKIQLITDRVVNASGTAQAIDATGKFVVPGFLDMHTHAIDAVDQQPSNWPLLIANGITGVREMRGSAALVQRAQQLNSDSAAGRVDAPEILTIPGDIFGGEFVGQAPIAGSSSAAAAVAEVQKQKAYGAGFIKTVRSTRDAALAFLAEAKRQGMTVAGHLSPTLNAKDSSNAGWKAIEHLGGTPQILLDCSANEDSLRASLLAGTPTIQLRQPILDSYDDAKCQALAKTFATNDTWHIPTLIRVRAGLATDDPLYSGDPNLIYVSKTTRAVWASMSATYTRTNDAAAAATLRRYYDKLQTLPKLLKQNGVKLLAGSDLAPPAAVWIIPGFSLHQEFALLGASGLSPLEVLQTTTLNGAEFLGRQASMGTVDEGKNADLVLLDANPVADVANLDKISAVFLKGRYFSKAALDKLKSDVAQAYAIAPAAAPGVGIAASVDHID